MGITLTKKTEEEALNLIIKALKTLPNERSAPDEKPEFLRWPKGLISPFNGRFRTLPQAIFETLREYVERSRSSPKIVKNRLETLKSALNNLGPTEHDLLGRHLQQFHPRFTSAIFALQIACEEGLKDPLYVAGHHAVPDREGQSPLDHLLYDLWWAFAEHFGIPTYSTDPDNPEPTTPFELFVWGVMPVIPVVDKKLKVPEILTIRRTSFERIHTKAMAEIDAAILSYRERDPSAHAWEVMKRYLLNMPLRPFRKKPGRPHKEECEKPKPEKPCLGSSECTNWFFKPDFQDIQTIRREGESQGGSEPFLIQ